MRPWVHYHPHAVPPGQGMHQTEELHRILAAEVARHGLHLVKVTVKGSARQPAITVFADRVGGITVGECVELSKALRPVVARFLASSAFSVDVSSPGTDRPLRTQEDFALIVGREVALVVTQGEGTVEVRGRVREAREEVVEIVGKDSMAHVVPYERLVSARIVLPF